MTLLDPAPVCGFARGVSLLVSAPGTFRAVAVTPNLGAPVVATEFKARRPEVTKTNVKASEAHLAFLDELRESGVTNMFGARPYLMEAFPDLSKADAAAVVGEWMRTFSERHPR